MNTGFGENLLNKNKIWRYIMNKVLFNETKDEIRRDYEKFNIPEEQIPSYENPSKFAKTFKKCTILEYRNISYSNNTYQSTLLINKPKDR